MDAISLDNDRAVSGNNFILRKHLNKLRWIVLISILGLLILLPFFHVYQTYLAAHSFDLLGDSEKRVFLFMEGLTAPFTGNPETDLDKFKGTTWSGTLFGIKLSDPLAVIGQIAASFTVYWPFLLTALIPVVFTLIFGRAYCGWICPATLIYELNDNVGSWLHKAGLPVSHRRLDSRLKYLILAFGLLLSFGVGAVVFANVYPPAIIGREIYYAIALGGFGIGSVFFLVTLVFDLLVARRGICRYLCPGGALYSILGRYRLVRIRRDVTQCNDCAKCNSICQFGLDPLHDNFGQDCNNCAACISVCPTDTLKFSVKLHDGPFQGPGHLGQKYKKSG